MAFDGTGGNCWDPDWPYTGEYSQRQRIAQFGDGYEQRTIDGLNPLMTTWKLTWSMRPRQVLIDMNIFLATRYGAAFPWLPLRAITPVLVFCDTWTAQWVYKGNKDDYGDLSAEFRRAYGASIFTSALP